ADRGHSAPAPTPLFARYHNTDSLRRIITARKIFANISCPRIDQILWKTLQIQSFLTTLLWTPSIHVCILVNSKLCTPQGTHGKQVVQDPSERVVSRDSGEPLHRHGLPSVR